MDFFIYWCLFRVIYVYSWPQVLLGISWIVSAWLVCFFACLCGYSCHLIVIIIVCLFCGQYLFPCSHLSSIKKGEKNRKTLRAQFSVSETWINLSTAHFLDILCTVRTGLCRHADWTGALSGRVIRYTMRATIGRGVRVGSGRTPVSPWLRKTPFWGDSER